LISWGYTYYRSTIWRERARDVRGRALDCGHFLAEEAPEATLDAMRDFLE
jgi:haloacetate dehalogenase